MAGLPFWDNPPSEMGVRLKTEIINAGLDEKSIVASGLVSRSQLTSMLHGGFDNVDGAALKRLANRGINIHFVLTGDAPPVMAPDEVVLLENYRAATPVRKASLREVGAAFAEQRLDDAVQKVG